MNKQSYDSKRQKIVMILRDRCAGKPYDTKYYVTFMDKIMQSVFSLCKKSLLADTANQVDENFFINACWEKLEDGGLLKRLCAVNFKDDVHVENYLRKVFENLLIDTMETLAPGFRARRKQVERVLKNRCLDTCRRFCKCWKLKELRGKVSKPAYLERLMEIASSIPAPEVKYAKKSGSRAPSVSDRDMEEFLVRLLETVGGMAKRDDIVRVITKKFNLYSVKVDGMPTDEEGEEISLEDDTILSPEHEVMAREILGKMDEDMLTVHYCWMVQGMSTEQIAAKTGWSIGTVHNRKKRYKKYIAKYFVSDKEVFPYDESKAIMRAVSREMLAKKGQE